ncbi:laminin subunit gamma-1 [Platysternon megacephalum]|uniref:Laminin subunit gamma-1 n=1 Tax=Platysternon megacephalum TaxID=55544 RepID=A0A4D9DYV5_9SAUR|nr:laminin subunit gamma-1 [Platysternon megacephalum]
MDKLDHRNFNWLARGPTGSFPSELKVGPTGPDACFLTDHQSRLSPPRDLDTRTSQEAQHCVTLNHVSVHSLSEEEVCHGWRAVCTTYCIFPIGILPRAQLPMLG